MTKQEKVYVCIPSESTEQQVSNLLMYMQMHLAIPGLQFLIFKTSPDEKVSFTFSSDTITDRMADGARVSVFQTFGEPMREVILRTTTTNLVPATNC